MHRSLFRILAAACLVTAGNVHAVEWRIATPYAPGNFHTVNIERFAEDVAVASGGDLTIEVHSDGALYKHEQIKDAVREGRVPMGEILLSRLSEENAVYAVDSIPFLAYNYPKAEKLWEASRPAIEKLLSKQGLMILYSVPWPPQGIYVATPLVRLSDLKGMKLRTYNEETERFAKLVGAIPKRVPVAGIASAFASGDIQAMITSPTTGAETKAWDFTRYYYHVQGWLPKNAVIVNEKAFGRLSRATQSAVLDSARRAERRGWKASEKETDAKLDVLRNRGLNVDRPPHKLHLDLLGVGRKMAFEWTGRAGDAGVFIIQRYHSVN